MNMLQVRGLGVVVVLAAALPACGGGKSYQAVRGSQSPGLDTAAYSTTLDRYDLQQALHENLKRMWASPVTQRWQEDNRNGKKPTAGVMPMRNETSEHIEGALDALISDIETEMVNSNLFRVVSLENQQNLIAQVRGQQDAVFDANNVAEFGKQLGVQYVVTGKVFTVDERAVESRRVQYFMFVQAVAVSTSEIVFQNKTAITKAIVPKK